MGYLDDCDIIFDRLGSDPPQRMLAGNGDVWIFTWVDARGEIVVDLNKSDAWDEIGGPAKLGQVRFSLRPNPSVPGVPFRQRLHLEEGAATIVAGGLIDRVECRLWVEIDRPVVRIEIQSKAPISIRANIAGSGQRPPFAKDNRLFWFHRNSSSIWSATMHRQSLEEWAAGDIDPLLYRTSGWAIEGEGFGELDGGKLESVSAGQRFNLAIHLMVKRAVEEEDWVRDLSRQIEQTNKTTTIQARSQHQEWWSAFWERSYIRVTGNASAESATKAYAHQRYQNACCRLFINPDGAFRSSPMRLNSWPMLASGDAAMMRPLFQIYLDALPMALHRTRRYFDHPGAFFSEQMHIWGTDLESAADQSQYRTANSNWSGGLELLAMMLEHEVYVFTEEFSQSTLLPLADAIITFYDRHYPRVNGKLRFAPAQSLDVWREAIDPMPEIAGLTHVLDGLLRLPSELVSGEQRSQWQRLLGELPTLPMRRGPEELGANYLIPAVQYDDLRASGNPELSPIFPYRIFGIGKDNLAIARRTFQRRDFKDNSSLDAIHAALLGFGEQLAAEFRSVGMLALQYMLLQCDHQRIMLLPAWPAGWDAEWKLDAPMRTTVEGVVRGGELRSLTITPEVREKDVILAR